MHNEFRVLGPPGTGKTYYLAKQIERAAEKHGAENVIVASYTKAAATTLINRDLPIPRENVGTLHALCYRALKGYEIAEVNASKFNEEHPSCAITVNGTSQMDEMAADAQYATDGDRFLNTYNLYRAKCLPLETMPKDVIHWVKTWEGWKMKHRFIDFTDMISITLSMDEPFPGEPSIGIYDEVQDFNKLELQLVRHWGAYQNHIILAGDDDQCHPAGTLISTSNRYQVPIECLDPDIDTLWNFDKHGFQIYRAKSFKVASRQFKGMMVTINENLKATYDHRVIARWNKYAVGAKAVYLMRKRNKWRIGTTDLIRKKARGVFGVGQRARQEGADAAWIISIHDNPIHAMMMEERLSMKYGISQMVFKAPTKGALLRMTQLEIDNYHNEISETAQPLKLLSDFGFHEKYPMWIGDGRQRGKTAWQEIRIINVFADYMEIPTRHGDEITSKTTAIPELVWSVKKENKQCEVFSLDVFPHHTYVANGVIVHNCIYDFCGASPEAFLGHPINDDHKRVLKQSYRLPKKVHDYSQKWIKQITNRAIKEFDPKKEEGSVEHVMATFKTPDSIIELAGCYAQEGKSVMILASCGYLLNNVKTQLRAAGLPFHNPYRTTRGDWNPMGTFHRKQGGHISTRERILSFLDESMGMPNTHYWGAEDLAKWIEMIRIRGILKKGAKEKIASVIENHHGFIGNEQEFYAEIFEEFALQRAINRDIPWFKDSLLSTKRSVVEYPLTVYQKQGRAALETKPKIILGTIHSVKGGEADVVILFPDLSLAAMNDYEKSKDATIRTFYVGMTRAKESLILCQAHSNMSVNFN